MKLDYLSNESLERLIDEIEDSELVVAPNEIIDDVLRKIDSSSNSNVSSNYELSSECFEQNIEKPPQLLIIAARREYISYCIKVGISIAASLAFIIFCPFIKGKAEKIKGNLNSPSIISTELMNRENSIVSSMSRSHKIRDYFDNIL